ncbi:MAG TPA: hypothetical protein VFK68_05570 [Propionibacteriaceae bacterium]|nr:hypothetical protein [Propionibacteriaceae bacterium]
MTWLQVDDSVVNAGWVPLVLVGVVALVLVVIYFSMRHHIRIANTFPTEAEVRAQRRAGKDTGEAKE